MKNLTKLFIIGLLGLWFSNETAAQTPITVCPQLNSFSGMTRGYHFTANTTFTICGVYVEDDMSTAAQSVAIVRFTAGPPPAFAGTTNNFVTLFQSLNYVPNAMIAVPNITVNPGDIIGVYGSRGNAVNSYGSPNCNVLINAVPHTLQRSGMQFNLATQPGMHDIWSEVNYNIGRVTMYTNCCPTPTAIPAITGPTSVCQGATATYTVPAQTGAINYTWTVPAGATITSGQGTTTLNVTWNSTPGGQICVDWTDPCATSPQTCINVTVNAPPTMTPPANITVCNGNNVPASAFVSNPAGGTFTWTNSNTAIGLAASGSGNTPAFTATNTGSTPITGTVTVTPTVGGCVGTSVSYTITVNPTPTVTVPANASYCTGDAVPASAFTSNVAGATFTWTNSNTAIGLAASGSGNTPAFTAANPGATPITGTITVTPSANGCTGTPVTYTITVSPTPTMTTPANITVCNGNNLPASAFVSNPAGGTFTWTNSNTAIGLAASGSGNTPAFTATNTGSTAITGTITVTPTVGSCVGTSVSYTITVNPTPTVTVPTNATYCPGDPVPASAFTSNVAGATFTWTNSNTAIGLAASGSGNTPAFTATNTGGTAISGTITVTPAANGCTGTPVTYTITVNPTPAAPTATSVTICPNNSATLTATAPGGTYEWYDAPTGGTLLTTGASYTTPVLTTNTTYYVQTTLNGCVSPRTAVTVTIAPALVVNAGLDDTICDGSSYNLMVNPNGAGYTYSWDELPGNLGFSTIFNPTVSPTATTTYVVTVTDANNCVGDDSVIIYVNPLPVATAPANGTYCNGDAVPASAFTSTPAGATFNWTNSDPSIGLAASGTGNTPAFTATNTTASPVTATITVTPTANGCVGSPVTYTITVNPTPTVTVPTNATYCNGDNVPASVFTSSPAGGTFAWTNSDPTIGLAASGSGNTPAFTATNTGGAPVTATITVTPTANGCAGTPSSYTITVNPTPTMTTPSNITVCNGDNIPASSFSSTPAGGTFSWTNSNTSIGLAASGSGNTPAFIAVNTSSAPVTSTVTVTPTANGCTGTPVTYTITVNPGAAAGVPGNLTVCNGDQVPVINFTSTPAGGTFVWTNSNGSIGLGTSGTGNTPAFTATNTGGGPITGNITVTATANGCPGAPSSFTITVNPAVTGSSNISICQGDSILIGGTYYNTAGSYIDTLQTTFGCDSVVTYNLTVNIVSVSTTNVTICLGDSIQLGGGSTWYSTAGTYPFTYTSAAGCDSIVYFALSVDSVPFINVYADDYFLNLGESTQLTAYTGQPNSTYTWHPPTGLDCIICQYPNATPPESMWYYVTVTNSNGCTRVDSVYIEVDPTTNIYIPNIFSPNDDGQNDVYYVRGKGVEQFNLYIYNRWGQVVFESHDINDGWDGTKDGTMLNQGVFVYKLDVTMYNGDKYEETGNITLIR